MSKAESISFFRVECCPIRGPACGKPVSVTTPDHGPGFRAKEKSPGVKRARRDCWSAPAGCAHALVLFQHHAVLLWVLGIYQHGDRIAGSIARAVTLEAIADKKANILGEWVLPAATHLPRISSVDPDVHVLIDLLYCGLDQRSIFSEPRVHPPMADQG